MNPKKMGIWAGAFISSFIVLLVGMYFLYPYLNPEKAAKITKKSLVAEKNSFDPSRYNMQAVDSLTAQTSVQQAAIDSLKKLKNEKQRVIDSLKTELAMTARENPVGSNSTSSPKPQPSIKEASKPLLSLDENALAPIVDLLDEQQLINLYREGSGRQREKLLRTLKPQKAAKILKKVM